MNRRGYDLVVSLTSAIWCYRTFQRERERWYRQMRIVIHPLFLSVYRFKVNLMKMAGVSCGEDLFLLRFGSSLFYCLPEVVHSDIIGMMYA